MRALTDQTVVVAIRDQVSCDVGGEGVILNLNSGIYFGLNPVGAWIWNQIQEPKSLSAVRESVMQEFEVNQATCDADLRRLVGELHGHGLVEVSG